MDATTERLARDVGSLRYEDLSAGAIHEATRHLIDSLGCALGGSRSEPAEIARRVAPVWNGSSEIASEPAKWDPRTRETADHSLPYMLAVALTDGRIGPASFEPKRYLDPALRPLMNRIRVAADDEFTRRFPGELPAEVSVLTRSGQRLVERAVYPKGRARNPMTDADVAAKFRDLSADVLPAARVDAALGELWRLSDCPRIGSLLDRLTV
jgi:2-methylcitrate dehydratase